MFDASGNEMVRRGIDGVKCIHQDKVDTLAFADDFHYVGLAFL